MADICQSWEQPIGDEDLVNKRRGSFLLLSLSSFLIPFHSHHLSTFFVYCSTSFPLSLYIIRT